MDIKEKIEWIRQNERQWFTPFDAIFMQQIQKDKKLENESFRRCYDVEMINLAHPELNDNPSRIGRLERVRSNIVRNLYSSRDPVWLEASMTAYITYTIKLLNERHQEIILALITEIEEGHILQEFFRKYLVNEILRRVMPEKCAFLVEQLVMSEHICESTVELIRVFLVGTCSYERMCLPC